MYEKVVIVFIAISAFLLKILFDANTFSTLHHVSKLSNCVNIKDKGPVENIAIIKEGKEKGLAFLPSSDLTHYLTDFATNYPPAIYALDLNQDSNLLQQIELIGVPGDLNVLHGVDCLVHGEKIYLFVVSHHPYHDANTHGEHVNIFEYRDKKLYFQESITSPSWTSVNDVAAVGPRQFYVSLDHKYPRYSVLKQRTEEVFGIEGGSIEFFDGNISYQVVSGLLYPNGITLNKDQTKLFVASSMVQKISVFTREENGNLTKKSPIVIDTFVDNLYVDEHDTLWIAGFPKLLHFILSVKDLVNSPVSIITAKEKTNIFEKNSPKFYDENMYELEKVHVSDGADVSGMSIVVRYKNRVIASSANQANIMFCNYN